MSPPVNTVAQGSIEQTGACALQPDEAPDRVVITEQMRTAINNFVNTGNTKNEEIITTVDVGRTFYRRIPGDGSIGIQTVSHSEGFRRSHWKLLASDGTMHIRCDKTKTIDGMIWMYSSPSCRGVKLSFGAVESEKATIIIGALFGFEELDSNYQPTLAEQAQAASLRQAMGLCGPSPLVC